MKRVNRNIYVTNLKITLSRFKRYVIKYLSERSIRFDSIGLRLNLRMNFPPWKVNTTGYPIVDPISAV